MSIKDKILLATAIMMSAALCFSAGISFKEGQNEFALFQVLAGLMLHIRFLGK